MSGVLGTFARLPVTIRIPVFVSLLMMVLSVVLSERVLSRFAETQSRYLSELGAAYLDGLSSSLVPAVLRDDVWEAFDTLDRSRGLYEGLRPLDIVVTDAGGQVLAASDPRAVPTRSRLSEALAASFPAAGGLRVEGGTERAYLRRNLTHQGRPIGSIYAVLDIRHLMAERRDVLATLIATNVLITLVLAGLGYALVRQIMWPVRVLADHLREGSTRAVEPIPDALVERSRGEARRLFGTYNALAEAVRDRETLAGRLAEEERLAGLGRLASSMAHEINNPLGGMFNALDTLKHHGETPTIRRKTIELLERGLFGIRDVVRATLLSYRGAGADRPLQAADLRDLTLLIDPELRRRRLALRCKVEIDRPVPVSVMAVRQIVLNLLLNACAASPAGTTVTLLARQLPGQLSIVIEDSGPGMPAAFMALLTGRDGSLPARQGNGLGLWLVRRLVDELDATIAVGRSPLGGACISFDVPIPISHGGRVALAA